MKHILCISLALSFGISIAAQELRCNVSINSDKIQGSNKEVYTSLQQSITELVNSTRWTNLTFSEKERIDCSMMIVVNSVADNIYVCEMQVQSRRPVFNTSYNSPMINLRDVDFTFAYQEFDRLEYNTNQFTSNLTSMLAYYCFLIIGYDMDSYSRMGGTPMFRECEKIVNFAQTASMDDKEMNGWKTFGGHRNRYTLSNNLMDEAFRPFREYIYEYHRLGLDEMSSNVTNGRARIAEGINTLREANKARPNTYVVSVFMDAKSDELTNLFEQGTASEKQTVYEVLMAVDPTRQTTYDKLNK